MPDDYQRARLTAGDRLVCVGDSITADPHGYVSLVQQVLSSTGRRVEVINAGVAGETAADMALRFRTDALMHQPSWVTICAGGNDAVRGVAVTEFGRSIQQMIEEAKHADVNVGLCTPTPAEPSYQGGEHSAVNALIAEYAEWIRQAALQQGLLLIPMYEIFTLVHSAGADDPVRLTYDGWHPSPAGRYLMGLTFLAAFRPFLKPSGS